jgi:hypothetical protein
MWTPLDEAFLVGRLHLSGLRLGVEGMKSGATSVALFYCPKVCFIARASIAASLEWVNRPVKSVVVPRERQPGAHVAEREINFQGDTVKFNGAGEKRKFYRNMRENVSARLIGYSGLRLAMMLTPVALCLVALVAVVMIVRGDNPVAALFQSHTSGVSMAMAIPLVKIREWREERGKLAADMSTLSSSEEFRTKEGKEKFAKLDAAQEELKSQIDAAERSNALEEETRGNVRPPADNPGGGNVDEKKQLEEKRVRAFDRFLRSGTSEEWARNHGMPALSRKNARWCSAAKTASNSAT